MGLSYSLPQTSHFFIVLLSPPRLVGLLRFADHVSGSPACPPSCVPVPRLRRLPRRVFRPASVRRWGGLSPPAAHARLVPLRVDLQLIAPPRFQQGPNPP